MTKWVKTLEFAVHIDKIFEYSGTRINKFNFKLL